MSVGQASVGSDRRLQPRRVASLAARLLLPGGLVLPATVADISPAGARITVGGAAPVHGPATLVEVGSGLAHLCVVAWRRDHEAGLKFLRSQSLRGLVSGEFLEAKRVWEAAAR